jgi:hypothetical protein
MDLITKMRNPVAADNMGRLAISKDSITECERIREKFRLGNTIPDRKRLRLIEAEALNMGRTHERMDIYEVASVFIVDHIVARMALEGKERDLVISALGVVTDKGRLRIFDPEAIKELAMLDSNNGLFEKLANERSALQRIVRNAGLKTDIFDFVLSRIGGYRYATNFSDIYKNLLRIERNRLKNPALGQNPTVAMARDN